MRHEASYDNRSVETNAVQVDWAGMLAVLYPILDPRCFGDSESLLAAADELVSAGCGLLQYRNKSGNARLVLDHARELKRRIGARARLIMNDRADLCLAADYDGVHVGQDDLSPESVRKIIGPDRWLGVSTHNPDQLREADLTAADYLAIGPVFATSSKQNPDPVVGLEGVRRARALTDKPLVAIGGITRSNAAAVIEAGADSVAVISDLSRDPGKSAEEFLRILR
ncbi:MAG TPA: thiamine phosphate synthase [Candidatus Sulfotelmatobacter sp.]|jgi:thiamine-phosphate pyrophosphorylase|nr:thiamine phosphate synthase [Candidatus Sulfotelmatobacter sp.]